MSIASIFAGGGGIFLVLCTLIQISPIKINPWSYLANKIGKALNGEVINQVELLGKDVQSLRKNLDEREAAACRIRIMRFGDELLHDIHHSKEHFDQTLLDITYYETYCKDHPNFRNNVIQATIENVKRTYSKCMDDHSFL